MPAKYDADIRARAVRLVLDHRYDYDSEWAAITAVSMRLGMTAETLRKWIRQHVNYAGFFGGCGGAPGCSEAGCWTPHAAGVCRASYSTGVSMPSAE